MIFYLKIEILSLNFAIPLYLQKETGVIIFLKGYLNKFYVLFTLLVLKITISYCDHIMTISHIVKLRKRVYQWPS